MKDEDLHVAAAIGLGIFIGVMLISGITEPKPKADFMAKHGFTWSSERQAYVKIKIEEFTGFKKGIE